MYCPLCVHSSMVSHPLQFCNDMYLMFDNAWSYNRKTSRVYRYCSKLSEVFEATIDEAMQSLGYCCGHRVSWSLSVQEGLIKLIGQHYTL